MGEAVQFAANEQRFAQFKVLDQLILEGILSLALALVGRYVQGLGQASSFFKFGFTLVSVTSSSMSQILMVMHQLADAAEKNKIEAQEDNEEDEEDIDKRNLRK